MRKLVACCDVVIENFKVGGLAKYGLDYASLSAINPRIVYCSITGFGQTGPYAKRPGYDFLIQGLGGLMSLTGHPDGAAGGGPMKVGVALTDVMTGLYASNAILAALAWRERSGKGQHVDLALLDVQVACLANRALNELVGSPGQPRFGNAHPSIVPYQDFPTADGHMILANTRALELAEAGYKPVVYIPREHVRMDLLERTDRVTTCPFKGEANYFSIRDGYDRDDNAVWTYEHPRKDVAEIAGQLAFYPDRVEILRA